ncbi:MAG: hypothetical protein ACFFDN_42800 [Candidatus Hodarchaeota archaeon]
MSKETLADKFSSIKFKEESKSLRKKISILILIVLIFGYIFLVLFNVVVAVSATGVRVKTKNFDRASVDNETIGIKGDIIIRNDHWYSVDIEDLVIEMEISTEDGKKIKEKRKEISKIPRLKNEIIELDFTFSLSEVDWDLIMAFESLGEVDELIIEFSVSARYTMYVIEFEIETEAEIEG